MCLLVLAWRAHPRYRLVLAANRDEYHERPADPLAKWPAPDEILAGRDQRAGGTWLGMDRERRFGVVTNFRELQRPRRSAPSRGRLIPDFLASSLAPEAHLARLETDAPGFSGFNLLIGDLDQLWYASNRMDRFAQALPAGVHGLSNEFLDSPWPKLKRVRQAFDAWLEGEVSGSAAGVSGQAGELMSRLEAHSVAQRHPRAPVEPGESAGTRHTIAALLSMLADRTPAPEGSPSTGLSPDWERTLSSPFVTHPSYGTRCSTILLVEPSGAAVMVERRFDPMGEMSGESEFLLNAGQWP
jgi:uncharacterized protein with NRDE domain